MFKAIIISAFIAVLVFDFFRSIMAKECDGFKVFTRVFMIFAFYGICGWI